jgi:hypothetical protein
MLCLATGQMFDLLSAGDAGRNDLDIGSSGFDRGRKPAISYGDRKIIMLFFKAKGTCHAAAARIDFTHLETRRSQQSDSGCRSDQSLLMAMAVKQRFDAGSGRCNWESASG